MTVSIRRFFFLLLSWPLLQSCGSGNKDIHATDGIQKDTLQWLQETLTAHPDSLKTRIKLSNRLKSKGSLDAALMPLEDGLRRDSTLTVLHNLKALLLLEKGDSAGAIRSLVQSINIQPEQTDVHLELGHIYAAQKNKSALTVADFLLSQSTDPSLQSQSRYLKGVYYTNMGMRKEAMMAYDEIILNDYTFLDAYLEKGILQFEERQFNEALKTFDKALTISNTNPEAYLWTGKCLEALGRKSEALDFYKKTVGLNVGLKEAEEGVARLESR
jgi:tetratricopeptide (TPR) repeat protein